ncbi:hypothetical protein [Peribacillus muralis]|uniref:hypothetical protein n=1 Tax=Peribacillus muralis TaxID=264697 RepID=UPI00366FB087
MKVDMELTTKPKMKVSSNKLIQGLWLVIFSIFLAKAINDANTFFIITNSLIILIQLFYVALMPKGENK